MLTEARLFQKDDQLILVRVQYAEGQMVELAGPYQCISDKSTDAKTFVSQLGQLLAEAYHKPVLTLDMLPEDLKEKLDPKEEE